MLKDSHKKELLNIFEKESPLDADAFFNKFNIEGRLGRSWNKQTGKAIKPYERLKRYETLLGEIQSWNKDVYLFIHKGTPFYFCGIHAFDIGAYDRAIFYFDAAFSEDIKNKPERNAFHWENSAAYAFYRLDTTYDSEIVKKPTKKIKAVLDPLLEEFSDSLDTSFDLDSLVKTFVDKKIKEVKYRSIILALYIFVYESEQRLFQLRIRSNRAGTIDPFIFHLLRGCLIFESLLKVTYSSHGPSTLGTILSDPFIKEDLNYCKHQDTVNKDLVGYSSGVRNTLPDLITHLLPYLEKKCYISDKWITLSYTLRNVTAHNLSWPDKFNLKNYKNLYKSVLFSIFYLIHKKH
jgi:hypothetical protein